MMNDEGLGVVVLYLRVSVIRAGIYFGLSKVTSSTVGRRQ